VILLALGPAPASAQTAGNARGGQTGSWLSAIGAPYRPKEEPPVNLANSSRMEALLRAGNIYLSLGDAIALALENNIDIAIQRYGTRLADASLLQAQAGGNGVPSYDPAVSYNLSWGHTTSPQTTSFITGTSAVVNTNLASNAEISRGYATGTTVALGWNATHSKNTSQLSDFNPSINANLSLQVTQHLLQGFGTALNRRNIRVAQNSRKVSDFAFRQQVTTTVANVASAYWDLVSYNGEVRVQQQAVALAQQLLDNNKRQVEIGTLAPIEVVRAQAQLASSRQELVVAQTRVLQQETVLKNLLSRTGAASPAVEAAHIIPTDQINVPDVEAVEPIQDLIGRALSNRPELRQTELEVENSKINLEGARSALRPTLDAVGTLQNNGLAGTLNTGTGSFLKNFSTVNPYFAGGFGTAMAQVLRRNFPDYSIGLQLTVPLGNRAAQAQMATGQLNLRQQELRQQQQINQIRVEVTNALIAVQQAQAAYQAAVQARLLQEETQSAEQRRYELGSSTNFLVSQAQRDLAAAQSVEVGAKSAYAKAKVTLEQATGRLLDTYNVQIDGARSGQVSRPPTQPPVGE
jgi:outer membrane protein TolC